MKNTIEKWVKNDAITGSEEDFLRGASNKEIENLFANTIDFGTGGMRGLIGPGPNRINFITINRAAAGFGDYLIQKNDIKECEVVIGYDNRQYSRDFALSAANTLMAKGIKVSVFSLLTATPVVSYAIRQLKAAGGIMITASHNPKQYNGFKVYDETGCQFLPDAIFDMKKHIDKYSDTFSFEINNEAIRFLGESIEDNYVNEFESIFPEQIRDLRVGYSPQHGTGGRIMKKLFKKYGFSNLSIASEQYDPDPLFSNTDNPNPESPEAFKLLIAYGKKKCLDLLLTTDPDADRLGAFYRNDENEFVRITGNQIGAILCYYLINQPQKRDWQNKYIVKTIVTSELGAEIAASKGVTCTNVLTGFKYIGDIINKYGSDNFLFAYEESFGYLFNPIVRDKDGVQIATLLSVVADELKVEGKNLGDYLNEIYNSFGYYNDELISIDLDSITWREQSEELFSLLSSYFEKFSTSVEDYETGEKTNIMTEQKAGIDLPKEKVKKFFFYDNSWVCVRPSGTEPKFKIYIGTQDKNQFLAKVKMSRLIEEIENKIDLILLKNVG